jgi:hypothetical protein
VTKAQALQALDDAVQERLKRMLDICADAFGGSANTKIEAEKNFTHGVDLTLEALEFATTVINQKFKD